MALESQEIEELIVGLGNVANKALAHSMASSTILQCLLMELVDHRLIDKSAVDRIFQRAKMRFTGIDEQTEQIALRYLDQFLGAFSASRMSSDRH